MTIAGLSQSDLNAYRNEATRLVNRFDLDGDRRLGAREAARDRVIGSDSYSFTTRISENYVERTTVYQDTVASLRGDVLRAADTNGDDAVDADEMVEAYLKDRDTNGDGKLGWWEKTKMAFSGLEGLFQSTRAVETDRRTSVEYSPQVDYNRPTPPSPSTRPTPPSPSTRPTPPSPSTRPTPPSPNSDRPAPPPVGSRPAPPSPDNSRPAPPSVSNRPAPPRA